MSWPNPERRNQLVDLYARGLTYKEIARECGGTANGVRSTVRKMRERGEVLHRPPVVRDYFGRFERVA